MEEDKKFGCFGVGAVFVFFLMLCFVGLRWMESRPKRMLERYLGLPFNEKIVQVESKLKLVGPFENDANIYLEAEPAMIRSILVQGNFGRVYSGDELSEDRTVSAGFLQFEGAPNPNGVVSVLYHRDSPGITETVGVSEDYGQIWYLGIGY